MQLNFKNRLMHHLLLRGLQTLIVTSYLFAV